VTIKYNISLYYSIRLNVGLLYLSLSLYTHTHTHVYITNRGLSLSTLAKSGLVFLVILSNNNDIQNSLLRSFFHNITLNMHFFTF